MEQTSASPASAALVPTAPDEDFDRIARLVRRQLDVPVVTVSLVAETALARQRTPGASPGAGVLEGTVAADDDGGGDDVERTGAGQGRVLVLVGAAGLPDPWDSTRTMELHDSFCRDVIRTGRTSVVPDVGDDASLTTMAVVRGLGARALAGVALLDRDGAVVGSVCAVDVEPRPWTETDVAVLTDLAAVCSTELRLRAESRDARLAQRALGAASRRSRLLLQLSEALTGTQTADEVARTAADVARAGLGTTSVLLATPETARRPRSTRGSDRSSVGSLLPVFVPREDDPRAVVARTGRPLFHESTRELLADFPAGAGLPGASGGACALLPLPRGTRGAPGVMTMAWPVEHEMDEDEREVLLALARYTAQALDRADLLARRRETARVLQEAMLTDLPEAGGLHLEARYVPASAAEQVGGDWYDALQLQSGSTALVIGDVTGHDMAAAALMGQVRTMLRVLAWEHGEPPSGVVERLDLALAGLRTGAIATAVVAVVDAEPDQPDQPDQPGRGVRRLRWSNAGHPPPVLLHADGVVEVLDGEHDLLLGVSPTAQRSDRSHELPTGSTLLLYTDGLVERRDASLSEGTAALAAALARHCDLGLPELLDTVLTELVGSRPEDDVALLAVRVQPRTDSPDSADSADRPASRPGG